MLLETIITIEPFRSFANTLLLKLIQITAREKLSEGFSDFICIFM